MIRFLKSVGYALKGIYAAIKEQRNLKIQLSIALAVVAAGIYFDISTTEWCIVLLTIALVVRLEMINSAIEDLVNLITQEHHPLAGKIKDIAAGAVLIAALLSTIIGILIFWKY